MKIIKIILIFISFIAVAFFSTGLLVKETNYTVSVTVNRPLDSVFYQFNNLENTKIWMPEIKSVATIKQNFATAGSIYQFVVDNNGEDFLITETVMAYVPNEKVTLHFDAENMLKTNDYTFVQKNNKTIITLNASCTSDSYLLSCLFPYYKSIFENQDQVYLNNFKQFVEQPLP